MRQPRSPFAFRHPRVFRVACVLGLLVGLAPTSPAAEPSRREARATKWTLEVPRGIRLEFGGAIGERMRRNIDHWLLPAPEANPGMLDMFRARDRLPEPQIVPWAGEFAGKYLLSAVFALRCAPRADLERHVRRFVSDLIATQAEDGYLGPFPKRDRLLGNWDLWGHYHVILGLLAWHDFAGDAEALSSARRAADLMTRTFPDGGRRVSEAGSPEMNMAVIHALALLFERGGEASYRRLIADIEKDWEGAGDYLRQGLAGVEFYRTPRPRWESLHDIQALVELHAITGDARYRVAFENIWRSIASRDIHDTGGFSSGEQAVGNPWSPGAVETCCTVAWMALSVDMLRLTGDPAAADALELATFNGCLGAQHPSGRWWTYSTPPDGVKEASAHAIVFQARAGTPELNCCSVHGPRGLGLLADWAVLEGEDGVTVEHYGPFRAALTLADGTKLCLLEETEYPAGAGFVRLEVSPERPTEFTLRLRIPAWSERTRVVLPDGAEVAAPPGRYAFLRRTWSKGDVVRIQFDFGLRVLAGDRGLAGKIAVYRGPLLLAFDPRFGDLDAKDLPPLDARAIRGSRPALLPAKEGAPECWVRLPVPAADGREIVLCDFASAGSTGRAYRSWLEAANAPPPPALLDRPLRGAVLPPGSIAFRWNGGRPSHRVDSYRLVLFDAREPDRVLREMFVPRGKASLSLARPLEAAGTYLWRVEAQSGEGTTASETREFRVDPLLPPEVGHADKEAPEPTPEGLLVAAPLRGDPTPAHGLLQDAEGVSPAQGPRGEERGAVATGPGRGRIRYALPWFPERDYTLLVRVCPKAFPRGRIGQVFSAWARGMDDPLRVTIDGGKIHARMEAGTSYSTAGVDVKEGSWIHVAVVKRGPRLDLWIDGEAKASVAVPEQVESAAANCALGANPNFSGDESLEASFADFAFYARALSDEDIRRAANQPADG